MHRFTRCEVLLAMLFLFTLPLSNPWVRGDGVGYYAIARSMLIEHDLDFTKDWQAANPSFRMGRLDAQGNILSGGYTATGHLENHFSVGPAILWSPFLVAAHAGVLLYDRLGGHIAADGFSKPYLVAMALGTATYGFLALLISFVLARRYVSERWAFLATLGIWFASSLPVYMYFNPSWSHAHSAFIVSLFLWYWMRTRSKRSWLQWLMLGALGGLMMDVYYVNGVVLLLPFVESVVGYWKARREPGMAAMGRLLAANVIFGVALVAAFLPSLISRRIIFGSYAKTGYEHLFHWTSPTLLRVCFSSDHGLFSWTPILIAAVAGLYFLGRHDRSLAALLILVLGALLYTIACYEDWDGLSSFGNRFFISLTPLFVLGLAALFDRLERAWSERSAEIVAGSGLAVLILWNLGLIFQWGTHLIPARGAISWRDATYNQFTVVPVKASQTVKSYLTHRKGLMDRIEQEDVNQLKTRQPQGSQ